MAAHPKAREHNVIGRATEGPALLQIWEVPSASGAEEGEDRATSGPDSAAGNTVSSGDRGPGEGAENGGPQATGQGSAAAQLPRMALGICMEGGVIWDCKWRPGSGGASR